MILLSYIDNNILCQGINIMDEQWYPVAGGPSEMKNIVIEGPPSTKCRLGWILFGANVFHYDDIIMGTIASQITSLTIVYSTVYSGADQSKHQSSASLAFVWGIHRWPVNSPHKWPVTRKMFPFDDVIMFTGNWIFKSMIFYKNANMYCPYSECFDGLAKLMCYIISLAQVQ